MMIDELGKYGTSEQLPFLYSCATNPIIGGKNAINELVAYPESNLPDNELVAYPESNLPD